jgi:hypothetical protein
VQEEIIVGPLPDQHGFKYATATSPLRRRLDNISVGTIKINESLPYANQEFGLESHPQTKEHNKSLIQIKY